MYILLNSEMNQVKASEMGDEISKILRKMKTKTFDLAREANSI